ncbi:MAG TPA: sulfatase-like hydrolase/transferase [Pyrinomonadaceae bacterium]|nr:sulfatase-like hydrolase/transferase [Pyrinomonadaceae bacterium]
MPPKLNRREFVTTALAASAIAAAAPQSFSQSTSRRPNVLFILADDLGYGDLSCYGRPDYQTPHLDRLAREGVRFANAYSASPLCTPTRCAFITGRYPARTEVGLQEPLHERRAMGDKALTLGLPPEHPTIASMLKQSGYETALIGKWHLGYLPNFGPLQSGFEEFFGIMSGAADFFTHKDMVGDLDLYEGKVHVERIGYMTDMLTERAVDYIRRRGEVRTGSGNDRVSTSNTAKGTSNRKESKRPFYLSLHYTAPHWPWEAASDRPPVPELRGPVQFRSGGSLKTYALMMKSLDDGIGRVLETLAHAGLERDTLVIFTSDNGGERFSYHWPFTGQKNSLWEGGIRVPAIVRWPGVTSKVQSPRSKVEGQASNNLILGPRASRSLLSEPGELAPGAQVVLPAGGRIIHRPAITMDWTATILAAAGVKPDPAYPLDGINLAPMVNPRISPPHSSMAPPPPPSTAPRTFFWRNANQDAALRGMWKYLNDGTREYLFNLTIDEREQADFRAQYPEVFNQLKSAFKAWEATILPRPPARS